MAEIRIQRSHSLGLAKARKIAWQWAEDVEKRFDMACTVIEGKTGDTVEFTRSGVSGRLLVSADRFELEAQLGFLLGAFSKRIEAEIEENLDALLAASQPGKAKAAAAASPKTAAAPRKTSAAAPAKAASAPRKPAGAARSKT